MNLKEDIRDLLKLYHHNPADDGLDAIIETWKENKGDKFDEFFKNDPHYVPDEHCLIWDVDYEREIDKTTIQDSLETFREWGRRILKPYIYKGYWSVEDLAIFYSNIRERKRRVEEGYRTPLNETFYELYLDYKKWEGYYCDATNNSVSASVRVKVDDCSSTSYVTKQSYNVFHKLNNVIDEMYGYYEREINEDMAGRLNYIEPTWKIRAGMRTSKVMRKILTSYFDFNTLVPDKVDRISEATGEVIGQISLFEQTYAKYSDAINPTFIKRFTVLSWNPLDYYTMSFGPTWTSCHTIDKLNEREFDVSAAGHPATYHGMYCSGTESYMLDRVSLVFFTVSSKYDWPNNSMWKADKVTRQMFHYDNGLLIQGRLYPDDQGDAGRRVDRSKYEVYRKIVEERIALAENIPNSWTSPKFNSSTSMPVHSYGTHYRDYSHYDNCNFVYLKGSPQYMEHGIMYIGHNPICPCCGEKHDESGQLLCDDCREDSIRCRGCGSVVDEDDAWNINGYYYCDDCTAYCSWCDEQVLEDDIEDVNGAGCVCHDCLNNNSNFRYCEQCETWFNTNHRAGVEIDGDFYCSTDCAEDAGYYYDDEADEWREAE